MTGTRWVTGDGGRVDLIHLTATEGGRDGWWFRYTLAPNSRGNHFYGGMCRTPDGLPALGVDLATLTEVS